MTFWEFILALIALTALTFFAFRFKSAVAFLVKYRGDRLVTCPENQEPAAVEVATGLHAAVSFAGIARLQLKDCSRWPEKQDCGQECLNQVVADPESCLVWNIVSRWYIGKTCVFCGKPFDQINWHDHRPALIDEELQTVQWTAIAPEKLPQVFATHWPVCWDCHIAESFCREHPNLVTVRPNR